MPESSVSGIVVEKAVIPSEYLERDVIIDLYLPRNVKDPASINLLLINDGQDLHKFYFDRMLDELYQQNMIEPILCVGIHCGKDRKNEYGTARIKDFKGRGAMAGAHEDFILRELLSFIRSNYYVHEFREKAYAGFSLGGLNAMDVVWNNPHEFTKIGVFSGSFWWRLKDLKHGYNEATDRIMHKQIREGKYHPWLKFYFTTGSLDEKMDRNHNGVIDSIDDTLGIIEELEKKGYRQVDDIVYNNYADGKHDVTTWGRAMPEFLRWGWGRHGSNK